MRSLILFFFFFNDTATTEIYTLSLHDALPIFTQNDIKKVLAYSTISQLGYMFVGVGVGAYAAEHIAELGDGDRKSTRLNSSHVRISYAVFCLKKKKKQTSHEVKSHSS